MSESSSILCPQWYQTVLHPCVEHPPCGENLEYDAGFILLQSKLQPKQAAEYGNFVEAVEPINWAEIEREAMALLTRSKDIRLVITLMRCRLRQKGVQAICEGLEALLLMLEQWPDMLHPQLLDEGEFDPLMRGNAFAEMVAPDGLLADLRQQTLPKAAGLQPSVRDIERAYASPREEGALSELTMAAIQQAWQQQQETAITSLQLASQRLNQLQAQLQQSLGDDTPDFRQLQVLLRHFCLASILPSASVAATEESTAEVVIVQPQVAIETFTPASVAIPTSVITAKEIECRADALSRLLEVRAWFTRVEPSSPVIALLAFTEQTIGKSFVELLQYLPAELIAKLEAAQESSS